MKKKITDFDLAQFLKSLKLDDATIHTIGTMLDAMKIKTKESLYGLSDEDFSLLLKLDESKILTPITKDAQVILSNVGPVRHLQRVIKDINTGALDSIGCAFDFHITTEKGSSHSLMTTYYYYTWVIYYRTTDNKEVLSAGHSEPQLDAKTFGDYEDQVKRGRPICEKRHLQPKEGETLIIKLQRGQKIEVFVDVHLWRHVNEDETQKIKNVFKSTHFEYLEMIVQSDIADKHLASQNFVDSLSKLTSSVAKAVPDPRISAGISVSSDAINLFRNAVRYGQAHFKDKLIGMKSMVTPIIRGWNGEYTLADKTQKITFENKHLTHHDRVKISVEIKSK